MKIYKKPVLFNLLGIAVLSVSTPSYGVEGMNMHDMSIHTTNHAEMDHSGVNSNDESSPVSAEVEHDHDRHQHAVMPTVDKTDEHMGHDHMKHSNMPVKPESSMPMTPGTMADMDDHSSHNSMQKVEASAIDHSSHASTNDGFTSPGSTDHDSTDHARMNHGDTQMQGGKAPPDARNPDYSAGRSFGPLHPPHMMADAILYGIRMNTAEWVYADDNASFSSSGNAWLGTDANRAVLDWDASGKHNIEDASMQLVWRRPLSTFWNYDLGVRSDYKRDGVDRQWLAANINGFAPYRFEVNATALMGNKGRTALKLDADYDLRITQRVVLQPEFSSTIYGKNDPDLNRGSGFSDIGAAFRLRYDINRQFAPYIGFQYTRYLGKTADLYRTTNLDTRQSKVMAGVRLWF